MPGCSLGPILVVTISTPEIEASERAYVGHLDYRVTSRGLITHDQANAWGKAGCEGKRFVTLAPAVGDDFQFRFIEDRTITDYRAFGSNGWNAAELIVADVDEMARRLKGGPFAVVGEPQDLSFSDAIRAMQVRGPAGEILYLTQFKRDVPGLAAPRPRCAVDRTFIVIVGGPSLDALLDFYTAGFTIPRPARMRSRVKAMSEAFGLSLETHYEISALTLREQSYIEADQMPAAAAVRIFDPDELPPGICMVSFCATADHDYGAASVTAGAAGELIELLAQPLPTAR